jgi:nucleoside-diphosphate-sugar epimerase
LIPDRTRDFQMETPRIFLAGRNGFIGKHLAKLIQKNHPETALRARVLLPAYRIKWCCIMMNEFLAPEARRRYFSGWEVTDRQHTQLQKAFSAFQQICHSPH